MLSRVSIACPSCRGANYRTSRWLSHDEKHSHPGMRPYRCVDCKQRFLALDRKRGGAKVALASVAVTALIVLATAATLTIWNTSYWWNPRSESGVAERTAAGTYQESTGSSLSRRLGPAAQVASATPADKRKVASQIGELKTSAAAGDTSAMTRLGLMHRYGFGVLQDFSRAASLIQQAAEKGDPAGMLELGRLYRDGIGFPTNRVLAYVWFNRAAAALNPDAVIERDSILRSLTSEELAAAQSLSARSDLLASAEPSVAD